MAYTEFYTQSGGSNLNAGSTTSNTASLTYASGSWVASTGVFTVASGNPTSDGVAVGDFASVYADGSTVTGFVGRVTARDATTITVSLTAKSGTAPTDGTNTRTLKIGGAWKGPNGAEAFPFGFVQNTMTNASSDPPFVNMKNDATYSITAAMTHTNASTNFGGYSSTVRDGGRATIDGSTNLITLLTGPGNSSLVQDLIFSNNGASGSTALTAANASSSIWRRCVFTSSRGNGCTISGIGVSFIECEFYACNVSNTANLGGVSVGAVQTFFDRCIFHDNSGSNNAGIAGVNTTNDFSFTAVRCIFDTNGLHGINWRGRQSSMIVMNCDFYNNGTDGIRITATTAAGSVYVSNCNFAKNGGYGISRTDALLSAIAVVNCGFGAGTYANTSGQTNGLGIGLVEGSVTYPSNSSPWVDEANGDFRIALAQAKSSGRGAFTQTAASYAGALAYLDIGACQHFDQRSRARSLIGI